MIIIDDIKNKLKKIVTNGRYIIYETNDIMEDIFSIPFLSDEKNILDGNILDCCHEYLDYISKENKITIIKGRHNNYYKTVLNKRNFNIIEIDGTILSYNTNKYEKNEIIDMYYKRENLYRNNIITPRVRVKRSLGDISLYTTPTGTISLLDVRNELGMGGQIDMNNADVRKLAGRPSGQIAMSDLRGKSAQTVHRMYIFSQGGSNDISNDSFGFYRASGGFNFGNFTPQHLGTPNLYVTGLYGMYLKGEVVGGTLILDTAPSSAGNLTVGHKYTNYVNVTINGRVFRFTYKYHPSFGSTTYFPDDEAGYTHFLASLYRKTVDVIFSWYN